MDEIEQQQQQTEPSPQVYVPRRSATLEGIINTLEWLLVALLLALVFRAFGVEAFQIPTGSMAEPLKGAHYHLRCMRCGYPYDVGGDTSLYNRPQCSSCGYYQPATALGRQQNGDRIFVLKSIYQYVPPRRWDVVVFKNPTNPAINYIKRLIALPGETVQLIDGHVFINGQIQRKPAKVQQELWMPIYDNDYQPFGAAAGPAGQTAAADALNRIWRQPFENEPNTDSRWSLNANGPAVFSLDENNMRDHWLLYNSDVGNDFHSTYAYNSDMLRRGQPVCSDLMMRVYVRPESSGCVGASLEKYGVHYIGRVDFAGMLILQRRQGTRIDELARMPIRPASNDRLMIFEFANVDHRLVLRYGENRLSFDLPVRPAPKRNASAQPQVRLLGRGRIQISHLGLFRDTYYISQATLRANERDPFKLEKDEFFVCGDNSPNSLDARLWSEEGKGITNQPAYRMGVVPMEYMLGKAFLVYWSDAYSPMPNMLPVIPNIDRIKVIFGGSDEVY